MPRLRSFAINFPLGTYGHTPVATSKLAWSWRVKDRTQDTLPQTDRHFVRRSISLSQQNFISIGRERRARSTSIAIPARHATCEEKPDSLARRRNVRSDEADPIQIESSRIGRNVKPHLAKSRDRKPARHEAALHRLPGNPQCREHNFATSSPRL